MAYLFWVFIFRNNTLVLTHTVTIQFCYLLFIAGNYYYNILFTIPVLLNRQKYIAFAACFLGGIFTAAWLRVPVSLFVSRHLFRVSTEKFDYAAVFLESFVNILFWVAVIVAVQMTADRIRAQQYTRLIEKEKAANELNFLRAQFNPHFLFNSINSIYAHIDKSNKDARDMLLVFSEMLRYQLYECNVEQIGLDREINYIRNYIALQKSRLDGRIHISFLATGINGNIRVAPLILIAFIENAFKHSGFNEYRENRIDIRLEYEKKALAFSIFNTKDAATGQPRESSGLGISNAKRRLELLYPEKHILNIDEQENDYTVHLTFFDL